MLHRVAASAKIPLVASLGVWLLFMPMPSCEHDCASRIHRAERNLQREIDHHGEHSRQAEQKRRELEEARRNCRDRH